MRNTARVGNSFELEVARWLTTKGWVVASRRHIRGPGDLLAVHASYPGQVWLVEVKKTRTPWSGFPPAERQEMSDFCRQHNLVPHLAWDSGRSIAWFREEAWPKKGE